MTEPIARPAAQWPRACLVGLVALAVLAIDAADAARLVDVRVGRHRDFVRVVFETDAPASFSIEPGEQPGERRVRIEAGGSPGALRVPADAGAEVTLEPLADGATLARIRAAGPVRIESQVLDRPPRIVFDLRPGEEPPPLAESGVEGGPPDGPELAPELREPAVFPDLAPPLAEEPREPAESPLGEPLVPVAPVAEQPAPPGAPGSAEPPAVSAPPPGAIVPRLDDRSLLIGSAGGLAVGLGLSLLARGGRRRRAGRAAEELAVAEAAEPAPTLARPLEPEEAEAPAPAAPAHAAEPAGELGLDLLAMLQRVDDRLAALEETLRGLVARTGQLELRGGTQSEELAAQRVALARLQLAITPSDLRASPAPRREAPAGLAPPPPRGS